MKTMMRHCECTTLLAAGVFLLLCGLDAHAQNGRCQGRQSGQAGRLAPSQLQMWLQQQAAGGGQVRSLQRTGQLTPAQLQNLRQNQVAQLQTLLLQLQTAQLALLQNGQALPQAQALLQQQIAQVQLLLAQLQSY